MNPNDVFRTELRMIQNPYLRSTVEAIFEKVPEWWIEQPSSSTGKYHPDDESGPGGMVLHTKRVVRLVNHLAESWSGAGLMPRDRELLIAAALVHDAYRYGSGESPDPQSNYGHEEAVRIETDYLDAHLPFWSDVVNVAGYHAGRWGPYDIPSKAYASNRSRTAELGEILHLADYIASRRDVRIDVERTSPF